MPSAKRSSRRSTRRPSTRGRSAATPALWARRSAPPRPTAATTRRRRSSPTGPRAAPGTSTSALGRELGDPGRRAAASSRSERGRLFARHGRERHQLDVLYRRLDEERLSAPDGAPTAARRAAAAGAASRAGCAASTPSAPASPTTSSPTPTPRGWSASTSARSRCCARCPASTSPTRTPARQAMERLDELVIKPRDGFGGQRGDDHAAGDRAERRRAIGLVRRRPGALHRPGDGPALQPPDGLRGRLRPRRVDLRPFVVSGARPAPRRCPAA